ncbi:DMP19 family protein [Sinomonas atrocyanea]
MSTAQHPVVLPAEALTAGDEAVVDANIDIVNAMYEELLDEREIAPNALRSYYVDFYLAQMLDGGFAQYALAAHERAQVDRLVREGLREMGAAGHLALFDELAAAVAALTVEDTEAYLEGDADGSVAVARAEALDDRFEALLEQEDLLALNGAWLRGQEGLLVLDEDGIEDEIARRVGLIDDLEERRAAEDRSGLTDMPDHELVIRELCDAAGHELVAVTTAAPAYLDRRGEALAWRFTTDLGEYVMVEEGDEAAMIDAEDGTVLATVEFVELDEDDWTADDDADGHGAVEASRRGGPEDGRAAQTAP